MRAGALLVCMIVAVSILIPVLLLWLAYRLHPAAGLVLESFMCYQIMGDEMSEGGKHEGMPGSSGWRCGKKRGRRFP